MDAISNDVGAVLALVVAVSLALSTALGPVVTMLTEAIKATGLVAARFSGLVAIGVGILLGMLLGVLTWAMAEQTYNLGVMLLLGAFAGLLMASGGISTYKAVGSVNTQPETKAGPSRFTGV